MPSFDFNDILQARRHLHGIVRQTPFDRSAVLSDRTNMEVCLKAECLQHTGSFKLQGAYHKLASLSAEEKANGVDCYKSEATPAYDHSGYTKQIIWLDKEELRAQKIEYFDRKKSLLKTQLFADYTLYEGKFWRAHNSIMRNHQTKKMTVLNWSDLKFSQGLTEGDFHQNVLKRVQ